MCQLSHTPRSSQWRVQVICKHKKWFSIQKAHPARTQGPPWSHIEPLPHPTSVLYFLIFCLKFCHCKTSYITLLIHSQNNLLNIVCVLSARMTAGNRPCPCRPQMDTNFPAHTSLKNQGWSGAPSITQRGQLRQVAQWTHCLLSALNVFLEAQPRNGWETVRSFGAHISQIVGAVTKDLRKIIDGKKYLFWCMVQRFQSMVSLL